MVNSSIQEDRLARDQVRRLVSQARRILMRFGQDCLAFSDFQSEVISKVNEFEDNLGIDLSSPLIDHPIMQLRAYVRSVHNSCWQVLYSVERLEALSTWISLSFRSDSMMDFFISYYFSGFISNVKTATDMLALMVNHAFELGIERERCALHRGVVANRLLDNCSDRQNGSQHIRQLSHSLEQARNNWIRDFYELRNIVTHRDEVEPTAFSVRFLDENSPNSIVTAHPLVIFPSPHNPQLLDFARRVAVASVVSYDFIDDFIDPIIFCTETWSRLISLLESASNGCRPQIDVFIANNR